MFTLIANLCKQNPSVALQRDNPYSTVIKLKVFRYFNFQKQKHLTSVDLTILDHC